LKKLWAGNDSVYELTEIDNSRRLWGSDEGPRRMEIFAHATELRGSAPTARAKSLLALSLVQMLFVIEKQLAVYRQRIEELFARHPDHDHSVPCHAPAPRSLRGCSPRLAMTANDSTAMPEIYNAMAEQPR
jgi:hypothetical protein